MISISVCMIVKNEEKVLARCLDCAKRVADEIIIVDTGSEDKTKEIASYYTDYVYDFVWCDDFSKARNYAFSKATKDFCMWLDADDVILEKDIDKLMDLKLVLDPNVDQVMMKYDVGFDENGIPTLSYYRERWIHNHRGFLWEGVIHEIIPPKGDIYYADISITHKKIHIADPNRNIKNFEGRLNKGILLNPREQFYYARELYFHKRYRDAFNMFDIFLSEGKGWIENNIDACELMGYCAYELENENPLDFFFKSFIYDLPRAEICCDIGKYFIDQENYTLAIFWYEMALTKEIDKTSNAFVKIDCYNYIPSLQLCVCWWKLGDIEKAKSYNEIAGSYKPKSKEVKRNQLYFSTLPFM